MKDMELSRVSTGIPLLDDATNGGFPEGMTLVYHGYPGCGKSTAGLRFLTGNEKSVSLLVTTHLAISQFRLLSQSVSQNLDNVVFVDGVNWRLKRINPKEYKSESKYELNNLNDLNYLLSVIIQAVNENDKISKILFDTPSSLLLYSTPSEEQVFKFFELLTSFVRSKGITMVYTLETGIHKEEVISTLKFLSDGEVEFRLDPENLDARQFQVRYLSLTSVNHKWIDLI